MPYKQVDSSLLMKHRYFEKVFEVSPLDSSQSRELELLLFDSYQPSKLSEEEVGADFEQLATITAEIKAINKQHILLIGERIAKVKEILKNYGDGQNTFTKWIEKVFGSKRTAYNILRYYEFFCELPSLELKQSLKKFPLKAAYCLANRQAPLEKKTSIIEEYVDQKTDDLILLIKEQLPIPEDDKRRKSGNEATIEKLKTYFDLLKKRKSDLSEDDRKQIQQLLYEFQEEL